MGYQAIAKAECLHCAAVIPSFAFSPWVGFRPVSGPAGTSRESFLVLWMKEGLFCPKSDKFNMQSVK